MNLTGIEANNAAKIAKAEFFDPVMAPDVHIARDRMESTAAAAERLRTLLPRLEDKARQVEAEGTVKSGWQIFERSPRSATPVSYTHLDVYKRQILKS